LQTERFGSDGLAQGSNVDLSDLGRPGQAERAHHHGGHILRLQEALGLVCPILHLVDGRLHGGCRPSKEYTQNAQAIAVDLFAQRIGEGLEGVL
jgi:hypothetical protein